MKHNRLGLVFRALDRRTPPTAPIRAEVPTVEVDGRVATLRIYDPVDSWGEYWGISAKELAAALDEMPSKVEEIRVHLNSPGGEVFEGIAIVNALRAHSARIVVIVDGIAASAASFIACAADETIMAPNSELMIHDAWGVCVGNAADMRAMGELLDHVSDNIASIYAAKAGTDVATWRAAMTAESWYSAEEAVAAGLADSVADLTPTPDEAAVKDRYDLSVFTFAGRAAAPAPTIPAPSTEPPSPAPLAEIPDPDDLESTPAPRIDAFRHLVASTRT